MIIAITFHRCYRMPLDTFRRLDLSIDEDCTMTSPSDITKRRRRAKKAKNNPRKTEILRTGTTPKLFKLDKPTANEKT